MLLSACIVRREFSITVELHAEELAQVSEIVAEVAARMDCKFQPPEEQWRISGKRQFRYCEPVEPTFAAVEFLAEPTSGRFTVTVLELRQQGPARLAVQTYAGQMRNVLEDRFSPERIVIKKRRWDS
jgi:hypothetical protein